MDDGDDGERTSSATAELDFVLDLLRELRTDRYLPAAWGRFFTRSWRASRRTAREHLRLVASWRRIAFGLALAEAAALAGEALLAGDTEEARATVARALPGAALCLAYTLGDAYVHLGMNQRDRAAPLYEMLGPATALTLARSAAGGLLLGHLLGGRPASRALAGATLATALATDIADGTVARATRHTTRLGAYLDGEADVGFGVALCLTLVARGLLPRWLAALLLARWMGPLAYTLARYFGAVSRVEIGSTAVGTAAGVAQAATIGAALLPERVSRCVPQLAPLRRMLHLATAVLLLAAPLAQLAHSHRTHNGGASGLASSDRTR